MEQVKTQVFNIADLKIFEEFNYEWGGEEDVETVFNADGSITETTLRGTHTIVFNQDGSITETYPSGRVLITTFNEDGISPSPTRLASPVPTSVLNS